MIDRLQRVLTRHPPRKPVTEADTEWRITLKRRTLVAAVIFALWAVGIEAKLVYLQVYRHADMVARASKQQTHQIDAPAARGDIVDRKGRVLATSVDADTIYAVPSDIANADEAASKLCEAFRDCTVRERQALADRLRQQKAFVYVRRQVSPEDKQRVEAIDLAGIGFRKESRRFYPNVELAAHLLGYVGLDNVGLSGLEWAYDAQIRGKPGTVLIQTDARRQAFGARVTRLPTAGSTIELTIDAYLQHIAERELHAGVVENRAEAGTAIVLNPHTGEILAMANEPTFNPNAYRDAQESERRNRAVQNLYEPGSTFKIVTASAAIEEKVMPIDTLIDTNPGQIRIDRTRVVREDSNHNYGVLAFPEVIVKSSNVGAIKIGFRVGTERMSRFVSLFGFGRPVSPDFPGESPGIVWRPEKWTDSALASVSMGYQIGVTPLQMVTAVSSVANGGELVEPRVLRAVYHGSRRTVVRPKVVRRTISTDTAATVTSIMEDVVELGTGKRARMAGYTIAGKTGTATKLVNGRYSLSDHYASFVGFVPSRNPALAIIVVVDSPHGSNGHHGGTVSAPIFKRIAEATLRYLSIGPTINPTPPVLVTRLADNANVAAGAHAAEPVVSLVADGPPGTVPDLRGLSARQAVRTLVKLGLIVHVRGDGFVVSQEPAAGAPIESGGACRLVLQRAPPRPVSSSQP